MQTHPTPAKSSLFFCLKRCLMFWNVCKINFPIWQNFYSSFWDFPPSEVAKFTGKMRNELKRMKNPFYDFMFLRYGRFCTEILTFFYIQKFCVYKKPPIFVGDLAPHIHPQSPNAFGLNPLSQLVFGYHWLAFLNQVLKIDHISKTKKNWKIF